MTNMTDTSAVKTADPLLAQCLALPVEKWPKNLMAVLIARLEDAIQDERRGSIEQTASQMDQLMNHVWANAPEEVRTGLVSENGNQAIRIAFILGSLSFAQELANTVMHHRPEDAFYEVFKDPQLKKVVTQLQGAPSTKEEIAKAQGMPAVMVDAKMKQLRNRGIVDFRMRYAPGQSGTSEYFLTPAAEQSLATHGIA